MIYGGYPGLLFGPGASAATSRAGVQAALHLKGGEGLQVRRSAQIWPYAIAATPPRLAQVQAIRPASQLFWPHLVQHMRVLIYNGDAGVGLYKGNEELVTNLETAVLWSKSAVAAVRRGEPGADGLRHDIQHAGKTFIEGPGCIASIRLAGHGPTFQPEAALAFISRYFRGEEF